MKLTPIKCINAKIKAKNYKIYDGNGLFLEVSKTGKKYWRLKYKFNQKEKLLSLGSLNNVTINEARAKRDECLELIKAGKDPSVERRIEKQKLQDKFTNDFESVAKEWIEMKSADWLEKQKIRNQKRLKTYIFPILGYQPIDSIQAQDVLHCIRLIEKKGLTYTPKKVRQLCSQIFRYAIATGRAKYDPAEPIKDVLKKYRVTHHRYLNEKELKSFLKDLETFEKCHIQFKLGIKLIILTFVRSIELRGAKWEEFDFDKAQWHIPAERMKMRKKHIVPLAKQSLNILSQLKEINNHSEYVFPNIHNPKKHMNENALLYIIKKMGYQDKTTVHGFRAMVSTILNEQGYRPDAIERQLAHAERNSVRAAYNHAEYMPERAKMMQEWADWLGSLN